MKKNELCACMCHGKELVPGFFYPWCLECFRNHGEPRAMIKRLRHYHQATRPGYPMWLDNTIFGEAADEMEKLTAVLMAVALALRQTDLKDDLRCKMISLILEEVDL